MRGAHADALMGLKLARELAVWFHQTYGLEPSFKPGPFISPKRRADQAADFLQEMQRLTRDVAEIRDELEATRQEAERKSAELKQSQEKLKGEIEERVVWEKLAQEAEQQSVALQNLIRALGQSPDDLLSSLRALGLQDGDSSPPAPAASPAFSRPYQDGLPTILAKKMRRIPMRSVLEPFASTDDAASQAATERLLMTQEKASALALNEKADLITRGEEAARWIDIGELEIDSLLRSS